PIVETKLSDTYISLFLLAVCCGMLMYIAVATFKKQPNILGTIAVFLCVSVFIWQDSSTVLQICFILVL
ncbi:hypothetical protein NE607_14560, partial [Dorea longicatena]|nr:hypothetical protein [Dorea longicatena]